MLLLTKWFENIFHVGCDTDSIRRTVQYLFTWLYLTNNLHRVCVVCFLTGSQGCDFAYGNGLYFLGELPNYRCSGIVYLSGMEYYVRKFEDVNHARAATLTRCRRLPEGMTCVEYDLCKDMMMDE